MKPLIQQLPRHYQRSPQDAELQQALTLLLEQTEGDLNFTLEQLFPSTTSGWGLALWEDAYGIPVDKTQSDRQRRQRIMAKIKGVGTTTVARILALAQIYWPHSQVVELYADYRFQLIMSGTAGNVPYLPDLVAAINELKPAHLDWSIIFKWSINSAIYVGLYTRSAITAITDITLPPQGDAQTYIGAYSCTADVAITNITV